MAPSDRASEPARVFFSGLAAWAITLAVASATWISSVAYRGARSSDEPLLALAFIFPVVMSIPFAFVLAAVTLPMVVGTRSLIGERRLWLAVAGAAAAPLGIVVMIAAGRLLFSDVGPTLWADLRAVANNPQGLPPVLLALVVGGIAFGVGIARPRTAV